MRELDGSVQVVGRTRLEEFKAKHADVRSAVDSWTMEVEAATWTDPVQLKQRYPSASLLAGNRVIFNLKGNKYRLDTTVAYSTQVVVVRRLGTHAEYMKWI